MFASRTIRKIEFTGEDGAPVNVVTIRKLSALELAEAGDERRTEIRKLSESMGASLMDEFRQAAAKAAAAKAEKVEKAEPKKPLTEEEQKKAREASFFGYARAYVLKAGIMSWTDSMPLEQGIKELDEAAADRLFKEILEISIPPIDPLPKG